MRTPSGTIFKAQAALRAQPQRAQSAPKAAGAAVPQRASLDKRSTHAAQSSTAQSSTAQWSGVAASGADSTAPQGYSAVAGTAPRVFTGAAAPISVAAQAAARWDPALDLVSRHPLLKGELSAQASIGAMRHHSEFKAASMVLHVGSSQGVNVDGVPFDVLTRILAQEAANRAMGVPKTICVIGQTLFEVAKPTMSPAEREHASRTSFALYRGVEKLAAHGLRIEARLDTDVMAEADYRRALKELKPFERSTYPLAYHEACLVEALRREAGAQVYAGWSSFDQLRDYEQVRQGAPGANRNFVRYCSMPVRTLLEAAMPAEYAMIAAVPGAALSATGLIQTHPDLLGVTSPHSAPAGKPLRLLLKRYDEQNLQRTLRDPFELDHLGQRAQIELQAQTWHTLMNLNRIAPHLLDHPRALLADLDVAERVVQLWKHEAAHATQAASVQACAHLWQSMVAAAFVRSEVLKHYLRALLEELGLDLAGVPSDTAVSVAMYSPHTAAKALALAEDSFAVAPERRPTVTLDTNFQARAAA